MENPPALPKSSPLPHPSVAQALSAEGSAYRFALLLCGDPAAAQTLLSEACRLGGAQMRQLRRPQARTLWLLRQVYRLADTAPLPAEENAEPTAPPPALEPPLRELLDRMAALPPAPRAAFALFHGVDELSAASMAEALEMPPALFSKHLEAARQALAPQPPADPAEQECAWQAALKELPLPWETLARLHAEGGAEFSAQKIFLQPVAWALLLALAVVAGVAVYWVRFARGDFPGREKMEALVDAAARNAGADTGGGRRAALEAIAPTALGKLDDWFLLKGFTGFAVPPELAGAPGVAASVWRSGGAAVAQVRLQSGGAQVLVCHADDLKKAEPTLEFAESERRRLFQHEDWAVALWAGKENVTLLMLPGTTEALARFLRSLEKGE